MATQWLDFKELKKRLKFDDLLNYYGVKLTVKGEQATGPCPLPTHEARQRSNSFSVNIVRGIWRCFGCEATGNVLDFAIRMEGLSVNDPSHVRSVALKWLERLDGSNTAAATPPETRAVVESASSSSHLVNEPLDFELKGLQQDHPYLRDRGLERRTVEHFGLGYCSRGLMKGRIAIPIHNESGRLIGYAGRLVDENTVGERTPKYLLPGTRERKGVTHEFRKSRVVYSAHRIERPVDDLIVVEGFPSVWWLWQCGWPNAVALMGSSCSPEQAAIIKARVASGGRVLTLPDSDAGGKACAMSVFEAVGPERAVRWVKLRDGPQPTDLGKEEVARLLRPE